MEKHETLEQEKYYTIDSNNDNSFDTLKSESKEVVNKNGNKYYTSPLNEKEEVNWYRFFMVTPPGVEPRTKP